jgi:hypothetical protein
MGQLINSWLTIRYESIRETTAETEVIWCRSAVPSRFTRTIRRSLRHVGAVYFD